ncbi:AAA family ATPase [Massilia sp. IC2-476]|uniref:AAA family ATPase n=1 Tax=Massilia sp. IC2-476 TaxID=2887199 RepID=UPI001D1278E4|nr:AAA family ATPase [Massilia sp. IC2-476]MCC2975000.1 AAA family ATPase [Massilia sp. IC2-476]
MLEKLISIKNIGKLARLNLRRGDWDGVFSRSNIIYAPNGTGKTTLSMIFQDMKDGGELIKKKKTFASAQSEDESQSVLIRANGIIIEYKNDAWAQKVENLEVFNVHFVEDNLFTGAGQIQKNQRNLFIFLSGEEGSKKKAEIDELRKKVLELDQQSRWIKNKARKQIIKKPEREERLAAIRVLREPYAAALAEKNKEMGLYSKEIFDEFVSRTNENLEKFSGTMRLEKISKELDQRTTFYLQFGDNRVTFDAKPEGHEFRYTLSEGDKSTLALALFLAKLSFSKKPEELIVVFDDPLTSLDSGRRFLTIKELTKLSERIGQLIVLTHDSGFAAELERNISVPNLSLELAFKNRESYFLKRNHEEQNLTGLFRDIKTLTTFLKEGASSEAERREIVRCIRPTLEGIIRVKYFDLLSDSQWLGDFIKLVRSSTEGDDLYRLRASLIFDALCDINDFSKGHHHSSPTERDAEIDEHELTVMVTKTLKLIKRL